MMVLQRGDDFMNVQLLIRKSGRAMALAAIAAPTPPFFLTAMHA